MFCSLGSTILLLFCVSDEAFSRMLNFVLTWLVHSLVQSFLEA